jgi:MFS transporter, AAHS family, 3-hydroxyphenylpropionic acid transporter
MSGTPPHVHAVPSTRATLTACALIAFCEGIDLQAAGVSAAGIAAEFTPSAEQFGTFFSASTFGLCVGALVGGRLSDIFGRRRVLLLSVLLFGIFSLLTPLASDIEQLSWARLLTGAGLGGALPNLLALVSESSASDRRNANVTIVYSAMPFGGAFVSLLSLLSASAHWRLIFLAGGAIPLLLLPFLPRALRESSEFRQAASFTEQTRGFMSVLIAGRALPTILLWVSSFLELLILYLLLSWLPTLLVGVGLSKPQAAGVQVAFNVGGGIAALVIGQLLESRYRNPAVIVVFLAVPVLVLLLSHAPAALGPVLAIVFALGCAILAAQGFLYATAPRCYPTFIRGVGVGTVVAMGRIGSIVGPKLGGTLKAAGHSTPQLLMDILPIVAVGSIAALSFAWLMNSRE